MRFEDEVLNLKPDVIIIDYSLNDRMIGLEEAHKAWSEMIEKALEKDIKVILCTPTWDYSYYDQDENWEMLKQHAKQVRDLATHYKVGLADSFEAFRCHVKEPADLADYLSYYNHPSEAGHELVAKELAKYFVYR
jgi:lysophospholipase L1-like esterase